MNLENSTIPTPAPSTKRTRKDMLFPGFLKKELTEEISRSYTPSIIAMEPPLTPGTSIVPPTRSPFKNIFNQFSFISLLVFSGSSLEKAQPAPHRRGPCPFQCPPFQGKISLKVGGRKIRELQTV